MRDFRKPQEAASLTLLQVEQNRVIAQEAQTSLAWRIYTTARAAYRQWTLARLREIEADDDRR